jgi:pimeloyl-ACP methyl ester carboxylesterase
MLADSDYPFIHACRRDTFKPLISDLNISQVVVVGHSMGGMAAVEFAHRYPEITNAIIMISSGIILPKAAQHDQNNFLQKLNGPEFEKALTELVTQLMPYNEHYQEIKDSFSAVSQTQWFSQFKSTLKWDETVKSCLKSCTMPMLYIQDSGGCYSDLKSLKAICPQLVVGRVVGSGHFPTIEVPDQVNAMIQRFVELTVAIDEI